jgi:signal transduction histidine kinase
MTEHFTPQLLLTILDNSLVNIYAAKALRDPTTGLLLDFQIYFYNASFLKQVRLSPDQIDTGTLRTLFPALEQSGFLVCYKGVVETGEPYVGEQEYDGPNGHFWYQTTVKKYDDGIVVNFVDITDSKWTKQVIQQTNNTLQAVLDATLTAVSTYEPVRDKAGRIVDFRFLLSNQAALSMLSVDELYGKTLCEMNPPLRSSDALDQYITVAQTGRPVTMERFARGRWFIISVVPFGEQGLLTSSIDITDLKQAQLQVEQLNTQLQRSNQSLDQFATIASHDLQEPLRKISTFADILRNQHGSSLPEEVTDLLKRIQSAAGRMRTLIRDVLTYAQLTKVGTLADQPVDLNQLMGDILEDLELVVTEKGAVIEADHLPTLTGNSLQLRQVFQNLLSNALKFTKPGCQPHISIRTELLDQAALPSGVLNDLLTGADQSAASGHQYYVIQVADNGIGFAARHTERIFGAFERLHNNTSAYSGTGIGLAIVRQVMENHNGTVVAQGVEGEGATFTLYLPVIPLPTGSV